MEIYRRLRSVFQRHNIQSREREMPIEPLSPKKYKALLIDVDGSLVPNKQDSMPSLRVTDTILKAKDAIHIGIATGQSKIPAMRILNSLSLSGPSIINSGSVIIDSASGDVLWQQTLLQQDIGKIAGIVAGESKVEIRNVNEYGPYSSEYSPPDPLGIYLYELSPEKADELRQRLAEIPTIATHKMISYTVGKIDIDITHVDATKAHAVAIVADLLGIKTEEIIAIGDGYNDIPFLMACGFRVAMGNAVDELKAIANYVAPSVEDDGVADVIEKFVLQP